MMKRCPNCSGRLYTVGKSVVCGACSWGWPWGSRALPGHGEQRKASGKRSGKVA